MPTTITSSIGTGGRNYSTIQAWEDACPANLVTADQIWKGELYNDSEYTHTSGVLATFSGVTTDDTRYLELTVAAGHSFQDAADKATLPLRYDVSKGVGLRAVSGTYTQPPLYIQNVSIKVIQRRLQINNAITSAYAGGDGFCYGNSSAHGEIHDCIIQSSKSTAPLINQNYPPVLAVNVVWVHRGTGNPGGIGGSAGRYKNCTLVVPSDVSNTSGNPWYTTPSANLHITNCAVFGWGGGFLSGTYGSECGNNVTDASTNVPGSNNQTSQAMVNNFINAASATLDLRPNSNGVLHTSGTRDATYTNDLDIVAAARPTSGATTVGAREYATAAPSVKPHYYYAQQ